MLSDTKWLRSQILRNVIGTCSDLRYHSLQIWGIIAGLTSKARRSRYDGTVLDLAKKAIIYEIVKLKRKHFQCLQTVQLVIAKYKSGMSIYEDFNLTWF